MESLGLAAVAPVCGQFSVCVCVCVCITLTGTKCVIAGALDLLV